jgi:hypothetical protein
VPDFTERMSAADYLRLKGVAPATKARAVQSRSNPAPPKPPALSRDTRRPWLDTILARTGFKGELGMEDQISAALADRLAAAEREGRCRCVWTHVPNEGARGRAAFGKILHLGMVAGAPDWWFAWHGGSGMVELKAPAGNRDPVALLKPRQRDFRDWCLHHGVRHEVCTSADEAWQTLARWGAVAERDLET